MTDKEKIADLERRVKELEGDNEMSKFRKELEKFRETLPSVPMPIYYPRYYPVPWYPQPIYPSYPNWIVTGGTTTSGNVTNFEIR